MTEPAPEQVAGDPTTATPKPPPQGSTGKAIGIMVVVVAAVAAIIFAIYYNSDDNQATRACEAWVRDQLKSPSSAKFSGEHFYDANASLSGQPAVYGKVDADNDFGASIRSSFKCDLQQVNGDWVVTDGYV